MDVNYAGAVATPLPFVSAELDAFFAASAWIRGTSPMDRALKIADALDSAEARAALLPRVGDMKGSIRAHRRVLVEANPGLDQRRVLESLIQMIDRDADTTIAQARAVRQDWWDRFGAPLVSRQRPHTNDRDPERPIRVGVVSANFKHSSAGNCLEAVLLGHSEAVQLTCYSTQPLGSDPIAWMFEALTHVVDVSAMSEAALAARVRADRIDILVDCMGFTYGNRLGTFCERPAPIQATGWGYATGTIPAMDVILLDAITAGQDQFFERVVQLPCVISYAAPAMFLPDVAPQPTGRVTFGAFHCFIKINPDVLRTYRRVLDGVPGSRIVFKGKEYGEQVLRDRIVAALGDRCDFWPQTLQLEHLDAFKHLDLVLDPFPQTGGITTCEALLMGVPSVTLAGERTIQRACAAILAAVDCHDGITTTEDDYVDRAVEWVTTSRGWLAAQRPYWRERLMQSPIIAGYPQAVEAIYRQLWRAWCAEGV